MGWIGTAERRKIVLKKILLIFGRPHLNLKTLKFISSIYFFPVKERNGQGWADSLIFFPE